MRPRSYRRTENQSIPPGGFPARTRGRVPAQRGTGVHEPHTVSTGPGNDLLTSKRVCYTGNTAELLKREDGKARFIPPSPSAGTGRRGRAAEGARRRRDSRARRPAGGPPAAPGPDSGPSPRAEQELLGPPRVASPPREKQSPGKQGPAQDEQSPTHAAGLGRGPGLLQPGAPGATGSGAPGLPGGRASAPDAVPAWRTVLVSSLSQRRTSSCPSHPRTPAPRITKSPCLQAATTSQVRVQREASTAGLTDLPARHLGRRQLHGVHAAKRKVAQGTVPLNKCSFAPANDSSVETKPCAQQPGLSEWDSWPHRGIRGRNHPKWLPTHHNPRGETSRKLGTQGPAAGRHQARQGLSGPRFLRLGGSSWKVRLWAPHPGLHASPPCNSRTFLERLFSVGSSRDTHSSGSC